MKAIECKLVFHLSRREIPMGEFPCKAAAKRYVNDVSNIWNRPYSIIPTTK